MLGCRFHSSCAVCPLLGGSLCDGPRDWFDDLAFDSSPLTTSEQEISGPDTFTGEAPRFARSSCFGCSAHDFVSRRYSHSCALGRPQLYCQDSAHNLVLRPLVSSCVKQGYIDRVHHFRSLSHDSIISF